MTKTALKLTSAVPSAVATLLLLVVACFSCGCVASSVKSSSFSSQGTASSPFTDFNVFGYNPVANAAAIVPGSGANARFTVLSDYVIRMEYSHTGEFEDRATLTVLNRNLPVPTFTSSVSNGWLTVQTSQVKLSYQVGQVFAAWTLKVTTTAGASYAFGDADAQNLLGTIKSLDELCTITLNCTQNADTYVHDESLHCAWGVVSRGGWTTIVDSGNYIMSATPGSWFNATSTSKDDVDVYFFGHGQNYRAALQDYVNLAGKTPMFFRSMLGSWFTRWYDYDNSDVERLVGIFEEQSIPLDVLVLDMNWHTKNDWTGYTWDRTLFPYPQDTLAFLQSKGLHSAANLHDADGVGYWEDTYRQMCLVMGMNPASQQTVQFAPLNATYMHTLEDVTLANANFSFYWIDWQQGGENGGCPGDSLNPTFITDHVRSTDKIRRGENGRNAILARWGGLGSHRYPVGFSGDVTTLSWECFAYQPYFSVTAANVAYGYISHDLVGPPTDHELHVRWMQFGAFSGVMRIHDRGMSAGSCWPNCAIVNIWELPFPFFDAIRSAMQERVALLPYTYSAMREGYDSGVPLVYPMYYDWPAENAAYAMGENGVHAQYMFGSSILVAPVCQPGDANVIASKTIWLPPTTWYDNVFGELVEGGGSITRSYDVSEIPLFIRAGAIVPRIPNPQQVGAGTAPLTALDVYIYPGNTSGTYSLYEDDASTLDYVRGGFTRQVYNYTRYSDSVSLQINVPTGSYNGQVLQRHIRVFFVGSVPLSDVYVDDKQLSASRFLQTGTFSYDGKTATATVDAGILSVNAIHTISVSLATEQNDAALARVKGYAWRTQLAKRAMDNVRETPYSTTTGPGMLKQAGAHAVELSYLALNNVTDFNANIGSTYKNLIASAIAELGGSTAPPPPSPAQVGLIQMWSEARKDMLLCGSQMCTEINGDYEIMWTEGYQAISISDLGVIPLNDFYSNQFSDNYADVIITPPATYQPAVFDNGFVYASNQPPSNSSGAAECLQVWVNPTTNDHMTLASPGLQWAQQHGYVKTADCIAWAFKQPPAMQAVKPAAKLGDAATSYAQEILQTVLSA